MADNLNNIDISWEGHTGAEVEQWIRDKFSGMETNPVSVRVAVEEESIIIPSVEPIHVRVDVTIQEVPIAGTITIYASNGVRTLTLGTVEIGVDSTLESAILESLCNGTNTPISIHAGYTYVDPTSGKTYYNSGLDVISAQSSNLSLEFVSEWFKEPLSSLGFRIKGTGLNKVLKVKIGEQESYVNLLWDSYPDNSIVTFGSDKLSNFQLENGSQYSFEATLSEKVEEGETPKFSKTIYGQFVYNNLVEDAYILFERLTDSVECFMETSVLKYAGLFSDSASEHPITINVIGPSEEIIASTVVNYRNTDGEQLYKLYIPENYNLGEEINVKALYNDTVYASLNFTLEPSKSHTGFPELLNELKLNIKTPGYTHINFDEVTDGYISSENALRVRGVGSSLTVNEKFFGNNKTVTFRFKTFNIKDPNRDVITYTAGDNCKIHIRPNELYVEAGTHSGIEAANAIFGENEVQYFTIIHSDKYIKVYLNGCICREFLSGTMSESSPVLTIDSTAADIDIYSIRYYNGVFNNSQVVDDYASSLSSEASTSLRIKNDIVNVNSKIDLGKIRNKNLNYIEVTLDDGVPFPSSKSTASGSKKEVYANTVHVVPKDKTKSATFRDISIRGQGTSAMGYPKWNIEMRINKLSADGFWYYDNNPEDRKGAKDGYLMNDSIPTATKLVWKINWASSMQSHKMALVNLYDSLRKECVPGVEEFDGENVRSSVYQEPFFLFVNGEFYGLVTFGPGKGDKNTFGDDGNLAMFEGSTNDAPLTNHLIPWNGATTDVVKGKIEGGTYDSVIIKSHGYTEADGDWEMDFIPDTIAKADSAIAFFQEAFNFNYYHNLRITDASYDDNYDNKGYWYLRTENGVPYLYRKSVNADGTTENYINVYKNFGTDGSSPSLVDMMRDYYEASVDEYTVSNVIAAISAHFIEHYTEYYNEEDLLYTMMFLRLFNATDNRAKNTYLYSRYKDGEWSPIHFMQDDLDTILHIDNSGSFTKPYYNLEHLYTESGGAMWAGERNPLYNTMETAVGEVKNNQSAKSPSENMMFSILNKAGGLSGIYAALFEAQEVFPEIAYNITAALLYENAAEEAEGGTATLYLKQLLGRQLEAERYWFKKRYKFLSSYAQYGDYNANQTESQENALRFPDPSTIRSNFEAVNAKTNIYLYPSVYFGGAFRLIDKMEEYVPRTIVFGNTAVTGGTSKFFRGAKEDYYSLGDFSRSIEFAATDSIDISETNIHEFVFEDSAANRLPSITVGKSGVQSFLEVLNLKAASNLTNINGLSTLSNLRVLDLRNTQIENIQLPETKTLEEVQLPKTVKSLTIKNVPNLRIISCENNFVNLNTLTLGGNVGTWPENLKVQEELLNKLLSYNNTVKITLSNADVSLPSTASFLKTFVDALVPSTSFGKVTITESSAPTPLSIVASLVEKSLQSGGNIQVNFSSIREVTNLEIVGPKYLSNKSNFKFKFTGAGNDFNNIVWSTMPNSESYIECVDSTLGIFKLNSYSEDETPVTIKVTLKGGTREYDEVYSVYVYNRPAAVGDFVYADGTYSPELDLTRVDDVVGLCFKVTNNFRYMLAKNLLTPSSFGPSVVNFPFRNVVGGYSPTDFLNRNGNSMYYVNARSQRPSDTTKRIEANSIRDGSGYDGGETATPESRHRALIPDLGNNYAELYNGDVPKGYYYTLNIIDIRNKVLESSDSPYASARENTYQSLLKIPSKDNELSELEELIGALRNNGTHEDVFGDNTTAYCSVYYPAASYCYAYQPNVSGELDPKFKKHNWWLPTATEMLEILALTIQTKFADYGETKQGSHPFKEGLKDNSPFNRILWGTQDGQLLRIMNHNTIGLNGVITSSEQMYDSNYNSTLFIHINGDYTIANYSQNWSDFLSNVGSLFTDERELQTMGITTVIKNSASYAAAVNSDTISRVVVAEKNSNDEWKTITITPNYVERGYYGGKNTVYIGQTTQNIPAGYADFRAYVNEEGIDDEERKQRILECYRITNVSPGLNLRFVLPVTTF